MNVSQLMFEKSCNARAIIREVPPGGGWGTQVVSIDFYSKDGVITHYLSPEQVKNLHFALTVFLQEVEGTEPDESVPVRIQQEL